MLGVKSFPLAQAEAASCGGAIRDEQCRAKEGVPLTPGGCGWWLVVGVLVLFFLDWIRSAAAGGC